MHVSEQQGEFINMDKIDEEDLEPGSDDELNQVNKDSVGKADIFDRDTDGNADNLDKDTDN